MEEAVCTTDEFARMLAHGEIPQRFAVESYLETLDFDMDQLTAEYVRRTMHEFFGGMRIPEKQCQQVIGAIIYCAQLQGLIVKNESRSGLAFVSTDRLSEFWGEMYGEVRKAT